MKLDWRPLLAAISPQTRVWFEWGSAKAPLRSLVSTFIASFRPHRFWSRYPRTERLDPVGLGMLMIAAFLLPGGMHFVFLALCWAAAAICEWVAPGWLEVGSWFGVKSLSDVSIWGFLCGSAAVAIHIVWFFVVVIYAFHLSSISFLLQLFRNDPVDRLLLFRVGANVALPTLFLAGAVLSFTSTLLFLLGDLTLDDPPWFVAARHWILKHNEFVVLFPLTLVYAFCIIHVAAGLRLHLQLRGSLMVPLLASALFVWSILIASELLFGVSSRLGLNIWGMDI
ncbi:MAG: hypothetical protein SF069_08830 [Phycisphaerae bacterium]|nr:hypothetical protein [Phycisphaerae bacterium]